VTETTPRTMPHTRELIIDRDPETMEPRRLMIDEQVYALTPMGHVDTVRDELDFLPEPISCDGLGLLLQFERAWQSMPLNDHRRAIVALEDEGMSEYRIGPMRAEILALLQRFHVARLLTSQEGATA
jgi:hypothetical protein